MELFELKNKIIELINDCMNELYNIDESKKNSDLKIHYYCAEINAFYVVLNILNHCDE